MAGKQLSDGNPTGTTLGQSTSDKIGFYGLATPIVQPSGFAAITTTVGSASYSTNATTVFGFQTVTQADAAISAINTLRTVLVNLGLMASS